MANTLNGINLPDGLHWLDEFEKQDVPQSVRYTLDGQAVVYAGHRVTGLPITLESMPDEGWMDRATVKLIAALAETPGGVYNLVLRSITYSVMFSHQTPPAFSATPLVSRATPVDADYYTVKIHLMTV